MAELVRRDGLKLHCHLKWRVGSTPTPGTNMKGWIRSNFFKSSTYTKSPTRGWAFCISGRERTWSLHDPYTLRIYCFPEVAMYLARFSSPHTNKNISERNLRHFYLVGERGLEPPRIAPLVPKTNAYTISPLARVTFALCLENIPS